VSESNNWEYISYDLWGNNVDGYEANAAYTTGRIYEIDDESDTGIIRFLHDAGFMDDDVNEQEVDIDGDEDVIYVNYKGSPALEFRRTDEPANMAGLQ
jgi:hypothetical protein